MTNHTIIDDEICARSVRRAAETEIEQVVTNNTGSIWNAFFGAECARRQGRFDLAGQILNVIGRQPMSAGNEGIQNAIGRHRILIGNRDASPLTEDLVAQHPPILSEVPVPEFVEKPATHSAVQVMTQFGNAPQQPIKPLPNMIVRGWNFGMSMAKWAATGFQKRTPAEIDERLAICQSCEWLQGQSCAKCGCNCNGKGVIDKLTLAGQSCPIGKWS